MTNIENKTTQISFKRMKEDDIKDIMAIEKQVYGFHCWSEEGFKSELNNRHALYFSVFETQTNKLIGYGGFWLVIDEGHITTIAISPEYQKKGIGEALLQKFIDEAYQRNVKWFTLEVRISNLPAQKLYEKYLFENCGVRHKYYQDTKEDALIMWTEDIHNDKFKDNYKQQKEKTKKRITVI